MISDEKMTHIVHLVIDGIWKADFVDYPDEDVALKEAKKICLQFVQQMNSIGDAVRKRILSQKSPPMEHTSQWEVLYSKYYEEEARKRGG